MTDASGGQVDRVLVLYYSQSGEVADIASLFTTELSRTGVEVTIERLVPETAYPYPWRSIRRFFDAMPESVLGLPPPIRLQGTIRRAALGWWFWSIPSGSCLPRYR